jgi:hypothetical protein
MCGKIIGGILALLVVSGFPEAGEKQRTQSGRIIGELKAQTNTPDGKNTFIEVLAPGEDKARKYHVLYDPAIKGPIESVLMAVRAAKVGDMVELNWVSTGHGPAIKSFRVFKSSRTGKVHELLKERLATLRELSAVTRSAYLHGNAKFAEVSQAHALLVKAELELCDSDKERLAVHEKAVTAARELENQTSHMHKAGLTTQASVLAARAARLHAEIDLERAKLKTTQGR